MDDRMQRGDGLLALSSEIERRLGPDGLGGLTRLVQEFEGLREALRRVGDEELAGARARIDDLVARLNELARQIDRLQAIKRALLGCD